MGIKTKIFVYIKLYMFMLTVTKFNIQSIINDKKSKPNSKKKVAVFFIIFFISYRILTVFGFALKPERKRTISKS